MSETIPEDVMKTARAITDEYRQRWHAVRAETRITDVWGVEDDLHALDIARAIMAERERAASIAEHYAQMWDKDTGQDRPNDGFNACMEAAAAIRNA